MSEKITAVANGVAGPLASLKDGVFSEKMLGDGVVINISDDVKEFTVVAPISGRVVTAFPTGHAYGIKTKSGVEVLVHVGLDTVNLDGEGFIMKIKQGKKIKVGAPLVVVNAEYVRKHAPSVNPIIVITSGQEISDIVNGEVSFGDDVFTV